jgi:hypothetical protein
VVSFTNKTDRHEIIEILLKVALNTINQAHPNLILELFDPLKLSTSQNGRGNCWNILEQKC